MLNRVITVDFNKKCGKIKPLGGINGAPRSGGYNLPYDFTEEFAQMNIPFVRVGMPTGEYGLNQFVDIHAIFPDPDADETLEESYNFLPTDLYIASVRGAGSDVFFRLGESREPYSRRLYTTLSVTPEKWASICEHIIMHYNEGWAAGYKLGIKWWEIWSGADSPEGFSGTPHEYYELYRVTANRLRERFPKIKIGGYGMGGFYSQNRLDATEEMKSYVPFMPKFFTYITREETKAPLDFFTWNCYTASPDELAMHIKYARTFLDGQGLRRTKCVIAEYNTLPRQDLPPALKDSFPAELGASLILAEKNSADMMFYSTSDPRSRMNGLFSVDDYVTHRHYAAYNVMCAFGKLYKLGTAIETTGDYRREIYSLAATDGEEAKLMLVTSGYSGRVELVLYGCNYTTCSVEKIAAGGERGAGTVYRAENVPISGGKIIIPAKKNEILLISLFDKKDII